MPNNLYVMEAANLICGQFDAGDNQPGKSTHLVLMELKLPALENNYVDHYPGGAPVGIEVPVYTNRLEATFTLAGWQPEIMKMMGNPGWMYQWFTAYGLIRDRRTGMGLEAKVKIQGELGRMNPTAYRKGDVMTHEFAIRAIVHYELYMEDPESPSDDAAQIYYWDFFSMERIIGGINVNQEMIDILHTGGATPPVVPQPD